MTQQKRKKRTYGRVDSQILANALAEGLTFEEAGRMSGCQAKDVDSVISRKISRDINLKRDIIAKLEEKREQILRNLTEAKAKKEGYKSLITALAIVTDKIELLRGGATERIEQSAKLVLEK